MTGLQQFRRELDVFIRDSVSKEGQLRIFIAFAEEEIEAFKAAWAEASKGKALVDVVVGGQVSAPISSAALSDTVLARARTLGVAVDRALTLYDTFTKVVTGGYKADLAVFAGGTRVGRDVVTQIRPGTEVQITNISPFARKAEDRGFNDADGAGFTNGLFEGISVILKREVKSLAAVEFEYRNVEGRRLPSLILRQ